MKALSAQELAQWFKGFEAVEEPADYAHADEDGLFFTHPEANCIELEYPLKLEQLPFFARLVATVGYEEQDFRGAVLWFHHWGVWNNETIGYRVVEKMNAAVGPSISFELAPGHRFREDELIDAIGMLMQPMIFAWDSYYLPIWSYGTGEFFLHVSHDSTATVVTRTKEFHARAWQELERFKLNPNVAKTDRVTRFCHPKGG